MWKALSDSFERTGISSQLRLQKSLLTMRYIPSESMASHFLKFDRLVWDEEYDMALTALETISSEQLTLSFVKTRLLDEEAKRSGGSVRASAGSSSAVFSAISNTCYGKRCTNRDQDGNFHENRNADSNRNTNSKGKHVESGRQHTSFNYKCHHCGIRGHKRSECRKLKYENKNLESANAALDNNCDSNKKT